MGEFTDTDQTAYRTCAQKRQGILPIDFSYKNTSASFSVDKREKDKSRRRRRELREREKIGARFLAIGGEKAKRGRAGRRGGMKRHTHKPDDHGGRGYTHRCTEAEHTREEGRRGGEEGNKQTCILFSLWEKPVPDLTRLCPEDPLLLPSSACLESKRVGRHFVFRSTNLGSAGGPGKAFVPSVPFQLPVLQKRWGSVCLFVRGIKKD